MLIKIWWRKCHKNLLVCPHCWKWATTWIERMRKEIWQLLKMIMSHLVRVSWVKRSNVLAVTWLDLDNTPLFPCSLQLALYIVASNFELKCLQNCLDLKVCPHWKQCPYNDLAGSEQYSPLSSFFPLPTKWHTCFSLLSSNVSKIFLVIF